MTMVAPKPMKKKRPTSLKSKRSQAGFAFLVLLIVNILNYADRYVLSAVLPSIKHDFNMTYFQGGLLISSFLVVYAIATLPLGVWADRGIRKNIVALCVGIWSVATALAGFTQNRSEEHTSELQSLAYLVCRLLLEKKKKTTTRN